MVKVYLFIYSFIILTWYVGSLSP